MQAQLKNKYRKWFPDLFEADIVYLLNLQWETVYPQTKGVLTTKANRYQIATTLQKARELQQNLALADESKAESLAKTCLRIGKTPEVVFEIINAAHIEGYSLDSKLLSLTHQKYNQTTITFNLTAVYQLLARLNLNLSKRFKTDSTGI